MAAAAVAGGAIGGILGGAISAGASAAAAAKNRKFQKMMYKNRYRFTVRDMRKAGLNPILAATLGAGQGPPGATAQVPNFGGIVGDAVSAYQASLDTKIKQNQAALLAAQAEQTTSATKGVDLDNKIKTPKAEALGTFMNTVGSPILKRVEHFMNSGKLPGHSARSKKRERDKALDAVNRRKNRSRNSGSSGGTLID